MKEKRIKGIWILPLISGFCWGGAGIFVRTLLGAGLENYTTVCLRMLTAALVLAAMILWKDKRLFLVKKKDLWLFFVSGFLGLSMLNVFYNLSVMEGSLALAGVLLASAPIFVLIMGSLFLREGLTKRKVLCVALAVTGCIFISGVLEEGTTNFSVKAVVFGLISAMFYAAYGVVNKKVAQKNYHYLVITFYASLFAGITMLPLADFGNAAQVLLANQGKMLFVLIAHALLSSVLPYTLFSMAMSYMEAGKASILASVEPASAMLIGIVAYKEIPTPLAVVGLLLTIAAVMLLNVSDKGKDAKHAGKEVTA